MQTPSQEGGVPERSLRDLYYVLFRHRRKTLLFFAAVVVTVTAGTFLTPETYRSEAKLLVRLGRESVSLDPTATTGQVVNIGQSRETEINSEMEILKSRELAEKVVDSFGASVFLKGTWEEPVTKTPSATAERLASRDAATAVRTAATGTLIATTPAARKDSPLDRDKAVRTLMESLDVEKEKNSNVLSLSYEAKSPKLARAVVDTLIGFFQDKHIQAHRTVGSYQFFSEQTGQIKTSLAGAEDELRRLKNESGVASLEEQRRILVNRMGGLQREIEETEAALAASGARSKALRKNLAGLPRNQVTESTSGHPNYAADGMRQKIYDLQLKEQDLLSKYSPENPLVLEVRRQITEAQAVLGKEERTRTQVTKGLNASYEKIQLDMMIERGVSSSLQAKAGALRSQLAAAGEEMKKLNDTEIRIAALTREVEVQNENYRKYVEKLEQARIDQALETDKISNISIVQPATYPLKPIRPRKRLNLALGLLMGLFGGLGLAFASEYMDHTLKKPEDVEERLQLMPLAAIPQLSPGWAPSYGQADTAFRPLPSESRESIELLRDRLPLPASGSTMPPITLAVTSCRKGEGVSFVAESLAEVLSRHVEGRVLLVDGTHKDPSVLRTYGTAPHTPQKPLTRKNGTTDAATGRKVVLASPASQSRQALAQFLRAKGLDVIEARDGNSAFSATVLEQPDILLLDLSVDVLGAAQIVHMLRSNPRTEQIPIFFIGDEETEPFGFRKGIDELFRNPFLPEQLYQKIRRLQVCETAPLYQLFDRPIEPHRDGSDSDSAAEIEDPISPLGDPKVFADLLNSWTGKYKAVVFDMPPVWDGEFSSRLAGQVDGVILVVEAEKVRWQVARQAKEFLLQGHARLFGVVLNKRQFHIPEWMYRRL